MTEKKMTEGKTTEKKQTIHLLKYGTYRRNKTWCGRLLKGLTWTFQSPECTCEVCLKAFRAHEPKRRR